MSSGDGNNTPRSGFTDLQRAELADIIVAVTRQQQQTQPSGEPGGPADDPPGNPGNNNNGTGSNVKEWNADEIGFFDPDYEGSAAVVNAGKHVFYRDVYVFIDRCKDMAPLRGEDKLRTVLPQCFRGAALIWHSTELSEMEKILLRGTNLGGWYEAMVHRFKERTPVALASLQKSKYTMTDAKDRKDPRSFVQDIIRHAKAANLTSVHNQLIMAWNNLDWEFRLHIPAPTVTTTVRKFLEELDGQADMWYEMARHRGQSHGSSNAASGKKPSKFDKRTDRSGSGTSNEGRAATEAITNFLNMFTKQTNQRPYGNQNRAYTNNYQNRSSPAIESKKPLLITSGSSESDSKKKNDRTDRDRSKGYGKGKKAYVVDEDDEETEPQSYYQKDEDEDVDYYDPEDDEEDLAEEDPTVNMVVSSPAVPPSIPCRSCGEAFESNSKLHKHLRKGCSQAYQVTEASSGISNSKALVRTSKSKALVRTKDIPIPKSSKTSSKIFKSMPGLLSKDNVPLPEDIIPLIRSPVDPSMTLGTGYGFRGYQYAIVSYSLLENGTPISGCTDSGCGISLHDIDAFNTQTQGKVPIRKMATPVTVRGIGTNRHTTDEYAIIDIHFLGVKNGKPAIAVLRREVHLVTDLKANFLIGTDIMGPEKFKIDFEKDEAQIGSCEVTIPVNIKSRTTPTAINKPVHLKKSTIIPPHTVLPVPIHSLSAMPSDRDYLFEPDDVHFSIYAHMINSDTEAILVRNDEDRPIKIHRNTRLGYITEMNYTNAYFAGDAFPMTPPQPQEAELTTDATDQDSITELACRRPKNEHKKSWFKKVLAACATVAMAVTSMAIPSSTSSSPTALAAAAVPEINLSKEHVLPNGVTIHDSGAEAVQAFTKIVEEYSTIWTDQGFAKLTEEHWMRIPLKSDWEEKIPGKIRVYPLGSRDKDLVDKTFDDLHRLGRMDWTDKSTPFSYPCFVVWLTLPDGSQKGRVVVDVRGLNAISLPDVYALPLQSDVIMDVRSCRYITVVDCSSFFYQWRVHPQDRHKLTVVTHRGQESFNVAVMGYKNSPSYVQRQIDRVLRAQRKFARAYIDDIVIFSHNLKDHIQHLREVFGILKENNISVKPTKAYIGYPSVRLLGRKVDSLGLATTEDKLAAIAKLRFPTTLRQLETYLGLTGWLRDYVEHYSKISEPLQLRKTTLLKGAPVAGTPRRAYAGKTKLLNPTNAERESYNKLQEALGKKRYLVHFNPERQLYADVDSSKETGMGGMIYHVKREIKPNEYPSKRDVEPIMFLSRLLTPAETRYWPTELELAGLVWIIRKIRHLIETSKGPTIFYTDHGAALSIARQTTLSTSSTDKLNLRLVRASDYVQRFNIILRHKPGKQHTVPDALSRLPTDNSEQKLGSYGELDVLFTTSLVEMNEEFRKSITEGYDADPSWKKLIATINNATEDGTRILFCRENGLIFRLEGYASGDHAFVPRRLCIPPKAEKTIFEAIHDSNNHLGFTRSYERIVHAYYIRNLSKRLQDYIKHCPKCQVLQTRRHRTYGSLQPILTPPIPFHTLTIDFMLAFPKTLSGLNCMMSVTCKFSKRATVIPGQITWSGTTWAGALLERLDIGDWGLPKVIISDRDRKFLSDVWSTLFQKLGVKSLYSTAYHPQTDGQSERTNQTLEIAFRFLITTLIDPKDWPRLIGPVQRAHNNSVSATTGKSPNECIYGFTPVQSTDFAKASASPEVLLSAKQVRMEVADAMAFAQMSSKTIYDKKHQPLSLKAGDYALLKLHKGYNIPSAAFLGRKLGQQYAGPFRILEKIGNLAYRLKLPSHWQIHPVLTIAQLEPCPDPTTDPFERPRPSRQEPIFVDGDTDAVKSFEVEKITAHRPTARRGMEFLVRWKGYGPEEDVWRNVPELGNALDVLDDYKKLNPQDFPAIGPTKTRKHGRPTKTPRKRQPTEIPRPTKRRGRPARNTQLSILNPPNQLLNIPNHPEDLADRPQPFPSNQQAPPDQPHGPSNLPLQSDHRMVLRDRTGRKRGI